VSTEIPLKYPTIWTKKTAVKPASSGRSTGCRVKTGTDHVQDGLSQSHALPVSCSSSHWTAIRSRQPATLHMSYDSTYRALPHIPFQVSTFFLNLQQLFKVICWALSLITLFLISQNHWTFSVLGDHFNLQFVETPHKKGESRHCNRSVVPPCLISWRCQCTFCTQRLNRSIWALSIAAILSVTV